MLRSFLIPTYFLFSSFLASHAQDDVLFEFSPFETRSFAPKASYLIENNKNGNLAVFIEYSKGLDAFLLSKDNELVSSFGTEGLPRRYNQVIGQIVEGDQIHIFMKTNSNKKFGCISFDFDRKETFEKELDFKLTDELFMQTLSKNDSFFLFTIEKNGSTIFVYEFDSKSKYQKHIIDLGKEDFFIDDIKVQLVDLITERSRFSTLVEMPKIVSDIPNSIEITSQINKFYEKQDHAIITFDRSLQSTYVLEISLIDFSYKLFDFPKPKFDEKPYKNCASLLKDEILFQFSSNKEQMEFKIRNWRLNETVRSFKIRKEESIPFANTPIIIEEDQSVIKRVREVNETDKFLRKISRGVLGIALLENDTGYQITLGGVQYKSQGVTFPNSMKIDGNQIIGFTDYNNPIINYYHAYSTTKSIRIECLFDKTFNDVEGEIEENVFDRISNFEKDLRGRKQVETINKTDEKYIFSYYDKGLRMYRGLLFK